MMRPLLFIGIAVVLALGTSLSSQDSSPKATAQAKVQDVRVIGCLKLEGKDWLLTNATEPVSNAPSSASAAKAAPVNPSPPPPPGPHQFKLIGIDVFHLPTRKDQRVEVTGLLIPAKPINRINITTVVPVAPTCSAPGR
jgi:hypothetical protein